jgi:hypothetical protein
MSVVDLPSTVTVNQSSNFEPSPHTFVDKKHRGLSFREKNEAIAII